MFINKILAYYGKSYYKSATKHETGRSAINAIKNISSNSEKSINLYQKLKKIIMKYGIGFWYWPSTYPTAVDPPTAEFLYSITRLLYPKVAIEIGTYKGNAAIAIGQALADNNKGVLYTIDPYEQDLVKTAIRKSRLVERIKYIIGYSSEVIPKLEIKQIDMAFIDGDHSYESVKKDIALVAPYMKSGGVAIFHDVLVENYQGFDGPKRVVEELKQTNMWDISIYPTEVGVNKENKVCLRSEKSEFAPVGIAVCIKK